MLIVEIKAWLLRLCHPIALIGLLMLLLGLLAYLIWDLLRENRRQKQPRATPNFSHVDDDDLPVPPPNHPVY